MDHYPARQFHAGIEKELPDGFTGSASIVLRHKRILPSNDRILNLAQAILETLSLRTVDVTATKHNMRPSLGQPIYTKSESDISSIPIEPFQEPRSSHALYVEGERKPPPDTTLLDV